MGWLGTQADLDLLGEGGAEHKGLAFASWWHGALLHDEDMEDVFFISLIDLVN